MGVTGGSDGQGDDFTTMSEINVTPLVDVMLVLLVIFMATVPTLTRGVKVNLPRAEAASLPTNEESLILSIDKEGALFINKNPIPSDKLEAKLGYMFDGRPEADKEIFIKADKDVAYGKVLAVMASIKKAGIDRIGMVAEPLGRSKPEGKKKKGAKRGGKGKKKPK